MRTGSPFLPPPRIVVSPAVRSGTIETILAFDAYLKKRNIDLILLAFPYRNELSHKSGEDWGDAASFVLKQARETGIECVDATAWMTASADRGQAVYAPPPEDFHPLADGYRAMFEAVGSRAWRSRGNTSGSSAIPSLTVFIDGSGRIAFPKSTCSM